MPQATNLTIKNGAGVDKTFTLLSGGNDGQLATWQLKEGGLSPVSFPVVTYSASRVANARKAHVKVRVPVVYTDAVTGVEKLVDTYEMNVQVRCSDALPEASRDDAVAFATNVVANALIKSGLRDGLSLT